jgi:hypothetical protein
MLDRAAGPPIANACDPARGPVALAVPEVAARAAATLQAPGVAFVHIRSAGAM